MGLRDSWNPFIQDAAGRVFGSVATSDADVAIAQETEREIARQKREGPGPTILMDEMIKITGCATLEDMQARRLFGPDHEMRNLGFPQPCPRRMMPDPNNRREWIQGPVTWNRFEVERWLEFMLPFAQHIVQQQQKKKGLFR